MNLHKIKLGMSGISDRFYLGYQNIEGTWVQKRDITSIFWSLLISFAQKNNKTEFDLVGDNREKYKVSIRKIETEET